MNVSFDLRLFAKRAMGWICVLLLLGSLFHPLLKEQATACVVQRPGVLDLTNCSFDGRQTVQLDGDWELYADKLLEPGSAPDPGKALYVPVPGIWSSYDNPDISTRFGTVTYRVKLLLPPSDSAFNLKVGSIRTASTTFVNGVKMGASGMPGYTYEAASPRNHPYNTGPFEAVDGEAEIMIHVSNYTYANGGIADSLRIGSDEAVSYLKTRNNTYDIVLMAGFAFIGFYFFGQGLQRKEDNASVYLAFFCLTVTVYLLTHSEKLIFALLPGLDYELFSKIQFASGVLGYSFISLYVHSLFKDIFARWMLRLTIAYSSIFTVLAIVTDVRTFATLDFLLIGYGLVFFPYITYVMVKVVRRREKGYGYLLVAFAATITMTFSLLLNLLLATELYAIPPIAGPIIIIAVGLFVSGRHAHAYETIKDLSEELTRKDKEKDDFLIKTAFELKTPLGAIVNISQSMLEGVGGRLEPAQMEDLRLILGTGRRLSFLVSDILDYEQLTGQRIRLYRQSIDIHGAVGIVLEVFRFLHLKNDVRIKNRIAPGQHWVLADEQRVIQILYNLIDNALKFTVRGSIVLETEEDEGMVYVTVSDTGPGIPREWLERIFAGYDQVRGGDQIPEAGGAGLGLAITRRLVELHGGTIRVVSEQGKGSRFTFSLPAKPKWDYPEDPDDERFLPAYTRLDLLAAETAAAREAGAGLLQTDGGYVPHILVVNDDYAGRKALTNLLSLGHYRITTAASGEEALAIISEKQAAFDLCILDVVMAKMSGLELCRQIRLTYGPLDLPILVATPKQNGHFTQAALSSGANDFIHKPYGWEDLQGRVETLVQLKRSVFERLHSEIAMLRAQIKPHFLYNAINTIIWMSGKDNEKTRQLLYDLSHFLRGSFDFGNQETAVPFEKELELVEAYLSLEKARFGKRLAAHYDIGVADFSLPPLIVQPLIENAVRHGLMEKIDGGTVTLTTRAEQDKIVISVSDTGKGMSEELLATWMMDDSERPRSEGTGIGLRNINRRLLKQFGHPLLIRSRPGGGTEVIITIPWEEEIR